MKYLPPTRWLPLLSLPTLSFSLSLCLSLSVYVSLREARGESVRIYMSMNMTQQTDRIIFTPSLPPPKRNKRTKGKTEYIMNERINK
ncbi:hypothetical protein F4824DRAFT_305916 [Ustulina deusta]|nr:hypothetical protein F4824DRAFT_305916 [Ustulina deusta]